jgi:hypothetical protein
MTDPNAAQYACTTCGHVRVPGDPKLEPTLTPKFVRGKCPGCKMGYRFFEPSGTHKRDPQLGRDLAERGMGKAERSATPEGWVAKFDAALKALALTRVEFTSEDVTARAGFPREATGSAVGARINAAAKRRIIVWTGRMKAAERPNQHGALLKVWRGT